MVKRAVLVPVFALFFILTACAGGGIGLKNPPKLPVSFSADAVIKLGDTELSVRVERGEAKTKFIVLAPEDAEGLRFEVSSGESRAYFDGMEGFIDLESLPSNSFAKAVGEALDAVMSGAALPEKRRNSWDYKGECGAGAFLVRRDADTGSFMMISIPAIDLTAEFSSYKAG